jgi:hypothetical protein
MIFRIAQEVLANIARHARAQNVKVRLCTDASKEWAILEVKDDGQGFDPATVKEGMGMANIRSRCQESGGELRVESEPGKGAGLIVRIPLYRAPEKDALRHFAIGSLSLFAFFSVIGFFQLFSSSSVGERTLISIPFALPLFMTAISRFFRGRRLVKSVPNRIQWSRVLSESLHM